MLRALVLLAVVAPAWAQREMPPFRPPEGVAWVKDVEYGTGGGRALTLDILRPAERPKGKMPALVYIHGGGFSKGDKSQGLRMNAGAAARGYFTATIEYRLCGEAIFPAAIEDCKCAVRWLRAHAEEYGVDPERIGVWGHSAGGSLAALVGTSGGVEALEGKDGWEGESSRVACVVDGYGPTDFLTITEMRGGGRDSEMGYIGGPFHEHEERSRQASATTHVTKDDPPFLILHGTGDPVVPFEQSKTFAEALSKAGVDVTFVPVTDGGHGWGPNREVDARVDDFFDKHLMGKEVEVSSDPIQGSPPKGQPRRGGGK